MPPVKFDRIVSCSSEDPAHPAKNLLTRKESNRKWKCKEPGESKVSVIIQLMQPYVITGIDIGNEGSAFVEVLVSRTSSPDDFQVLLLMSSFMTPSDCRGETNKNRVRMFTSDQLSETARKEKWDRIKVVCTQPYNKFFQYGLSFLVLHSTDTKEEAPSKETAPAKTLGRFALKDDEDSDISVGSFFSRRKDLQITSPVPPSTPPTGAAAVRDASSPAYLASQKATKKRKGSDDIAGSEKKKRGRPKLSPDNTKDETSTSPYRPSVDKAQKTEAKQRKVGKPESSKTTDERNSVMKPQLDTNKITDLKPRGSSADNFSSPSSSQGRPQLKQQNKDQSLGNKGRVSYKPFNKLLEGVEIVISGYQNPGRSHIRDKALAMGARYQQNWSPSSTHLICAFPNTPKLLEAKGKGIIVTRDWIDDCHQERKKLAWRRYATEIEERKAANSDLEPEVWELIPGMNTSDATVPAVCRRNNIATKDTRLESDSEDSEDEIERIRAKQNLKQRKLEDKSKNDRENRTRSAMSLKDDEGRDDAYDCSTDVDSEEDARGRLTKWSKENKVKYTDNLPALPNLFNKKSFFLSHDLPENERLSLCRYIIAYGGDLLEASSKSAHYIISRKKQKLSDEAKSVCVKPEWIWECNDRQSLISPSSYEPA